MIISYGKRKLGRKGKFTLDVSLPKAWLLKQDLNAGDYLELFENEDGFLIIKPLNVKIIKKGRAQGQRAQGRCGGGVNASH